ncbi:MAG: phosphoribosylglycinamide formyltransferase, partial [Oscillospiraceae bacterium]
ELGLAKIELVIASNRKAYALERAEKANIKTAVVSRKECEDSKEFDAKILKHLKDNGIELVVLAGFLSILGKDIINEYQDRIINIHPSLIPSFCGSGFYGLKVHEAALTYGVKVTGATVHYVNEIPDGGNIILQKAVYVEPNDTAETLQRRVMEQAEWEILPKATAMVCEIIEKNREISQQNNSNKSSKPL